MRVSQVILNKNQRIRDIACKKYYCEACDRACRDLTALRLHLNGARHKQKPIKVEKHECLCCDYSTPKKGNMVIHYKSQKHIRNSTTESQTN